MSEYCFVKIYNDECDKIKIEITLIRRNNNMDNNAISDLKRALELHEEFKKLSNIAYADPPEEPKPVVDFEEYCRRRNIRLLKDFSFITFPDYCNKNGVLKPVKPRHKKEFWDDAEKYFTYDYFKYEYGFFLVAFSRDEKYRKYRSQYAGTKIETFLKELNAKKLSFSEKLKAPRQYHDEFLVLLNKLRNEWDDYDKCQIIYEKAKQEYDQELNEAKKEYAISIEPIVEKAKSDYEIYYAKEKEKYDIAYANYLKEKKDIENRIKQQRAYSDNLHNEYNMILRKWEVPFENIPFVLEYLEKGKAKTVKEIVETFKTYVVKYKHRNYDYCDQIKVKADGPSNAMEVVMNKVGDPDIEIIDVIGG